MYKIRKFILQSVSNEGGGVERSKEVSPQSVYVNLLTKIDYTTRCICVFGGSGNETNSADTYTQTQSVVEDSGNEGMVVLMNFVFESAQDVRLFINGLESMGAATEKKERKGERSSQSKILKSVRESKGVLLKESQAQRSESAFCRMMSVQSDFIAFSQDTSATQHTNAFRESGHQESTQGSVFALKNGQQAGVRLEGIFQDGVQSREQNTYYTQENENPET
ncbi:hypothetical protein AX774_g2795, partial [Zancudomyces culisetae]